MPLALLLGALALVCFLIDDLYRLIRTHIRHANEPVQDHGLATHQNGGTPTR
jgi:hypothetical protein